MTMLVVYGMSSLFVGAVSTAGSVASTGAQVSATAANQNGTSSDLANSVTQQVQTAVASAASAASGPQAEQDARHAADTAARAVARASWFSFAALVVGAIIAAVSGNAGFRHQPPFEDGGGADGEAEAVSPRSRVVRPSRPL